MIQLFTAVVYSGLMLSLDNSNMSKLTFSSNSLNSARAFPSENFVTTFQPIASNVAEKSVP